MCIKNLVRQGWHRPASVGIAKLEFPFSSVSVAFKLATTPPIDFYMFKQLFINKIL